MCTYKSGHATKMIENRFDAVKVESGQLLVVQLNGLFHWAFDITMSNK